MGDFSSQNSKTPMPTRQKNASGKLKNDKKNHTNIQKFVMGIHT